MHSSKQSSKIVSLKFGISILNNSNNKITVKCNLGLRGWGVNMWHRLLSNSSITLWLFTEWARTGSYFYMSTGAIFGRLKTTCSLYVFGRSAFLFLCFNNVREGFLSIVTICIALKCHTLSSINSLHTSLDQDQWLSTEDKEGNAAWHENEKQTKSQIPQLFLLKAEMHPNSTPFSHSLILNYRTSWGCISRPVVKTTLCACVCESEWQRGVCVHMHAQLFSLPCHISEIDGEKFPIRRKTVWCFKAKIENTRFNVLVWVSFTKASTKTILTSLGRGSLEYGWTWALGCSLVGDCWWLNDSSISLPGWWVLLGKKKKVSISLDIYSQVCFKENNKTHDLPLTSGP